MICKQKDNKNVDMLGILITYAGECLKTGVDPKK